MTCTYKCTSCNRDASLATNCACLAARRSQTTKRPATTFSGNSFCEYFFLFLFLAQRERVSIGADCASKHMQISRSRLQDLCIVVCTSCNRDASLVTNCACRAARRSQNDNSTSNNILGEFFFVNSFSFFLFSHRGNAFWSVQIGRRTTRRSAEARGKTCAWLHGPAATGMPVS